MKPLVLLALLLALAAASTAQASPRPTCPHNAHCRIHWAGYWYTQPGHDQTGHSYERACHVSARGLRRCGAWRLRVVDDA